MQPYSATISCSVVTSLAPYDLLTPKEQKFYHKIHMKCYFVKLQNHFSQDLLFIGCDIFPQVTVICLHLIKHVALGFDIFVALPVWILRTKLWKIFMKCKIDMFLTFVPLFWKFWFLSLWYFISPCTNPIFAAVIWIHKIQVFDEALFPHNNLLMITVKLPFSYFYGNYY